MIVAHAYKERPAFFYYENPNPSIHLRQLGFASVADTHL